MNKHIDKIEKSLEDITESEGKIIAKGKEIEQAYLKLYEILKGSGIHLNFVVKSDEKPQRYTIEETEDYLEIEAYNKYRIRIGYKESEKIVETKRSLLHPLGRKREYYMEFGVFEVQEIPDDCYRGTVLSYYYEHTKFENYMKKLAERRVRYSEIRPEEIDNLIKDMAELPKHIAQYMEGVAKVPKEVLEINPMDGVEAIKAAEQNSI